MPGLVWTADKSAASGMEKVEDVRRGVVCTICQKKTRGCCLSCLGGGGATCQHKFHGAQHNTTRKLGHRGGTSVGSWTACLLSLRSCLSVLCLFQFCALFASEGTRSPKINAAADATAHRTRRARNRHSDRSLSRRLRHVLSCRQPFSRLTCMKCAQLFLIESRDLALRVGRPRLRTCMPPRRHDHRLQCSEEEKPERKCWTCLNVEQFNHNQRTAEY